MKENIIDQMLKVSKAAIKARENLGKTVEYSRVDVLDEVAESLMKNPLKKPILFGVKDTDQISLNIIHKLIEEDYIFHTIDTLSTGGRAIDVDLINPLTGNIMTGSSSGSCINILLGINDFALGTDGGGSVLGPAMSTGLYSIMAKGLGIKGNREKLSTDKISFTPGVGVISYDYNLCMEVISKIVSIEYIKEQELKQYKIKVAIPKEINSNDGIYKIINELKNIVEFIEVDFGDNSRENLISKCNELFDNNIDIIMTEEGPVDLYGKGDSVLGTWGDTGREIQDLSGKQLLKVANMINATAITIPTGELGVGILILGKEGLEGGNLCISLGNIIKDIFQIPSLFKHYFINGYKRKKGGLI